MSQIKQLILKFTFMIIIPLTMFGGCQALLFSDYIGGVAGIFQPLTKPTRIVFVDDSTNKPLAGLKVRFLWQALSSSMADGRGYAYHHEDMITQSDGSIQLPRQRKPFPVVLFPFWVRGHQGVWMFFRSWQYEEEDCFDTGRGCASTPFKIRGDETDKTIRLKPAISLDSKLKALSFNKGFFGKDFWEEGAATVINNYGFDSIDTQRLSIMADTCEELKSVICEEFNMELLARNNNKGDEYRSRTAAIRLGIVTPAMINYMTGVETKIKNRDPISGIEIKEAEAIRQVLNKQKGRGP